MTDLIPPYGGKLTCLMAEGAQLDALLREASSLPSLILNPRQLCDLELLLNGALSPLAGFMNHADYACVLSDLCLTDGTFWPMPVTLDIARDFAATLTPGCRVTLRDDKENALAILTVGEVWKAEKSLEARHVYGTDEADHPGMACLAQGGCHYAGGALEGLTLPRRDDFTALRLTPRTTREALMHQGRRRVVSFQPHNVMHRAQFEFTLHSAEDNNAGLLIQAMGGESPTPDFFTRIRCYLALLPHYPEGLARLSLLPLAPRPAGVREVLWRAIIARNYGCSHFVIGGDAGAGEIRRGTDALAPTRIRPLAEHFAAIGVEPITFPRVLYVPELAQYMPEEYIPFGLATWNLPARELQQRLMEGREDIPRWASFPEVVAELHRQHPPRSRRGFTVFFTGLPASGKTTLSQALRLRLMELTGRPVTLLDGDAVRTLLSSGLSYSKADRDLNVRRIGFVAAEITRHNGIAICAQIAPYREARQAVREMISPLGGFFEVHVSTPLEVCEARDPKGLYTKARAGIIKEFTGISAPHEAPHAPEIEVDTGHTHVEEAVARIVHALTGEGYLVSAT